MLNQIAAQIYIFLIRGPLIDPQQLVYGTRAPQTALMPESIWLHRLIPGTRLHTGLILAVLLAVLVYVFLWRTTIGYRMRAVGAGPEAARYGGIRVEFYLVLAMALAGALAGLAGTSGGAGSSPPGPGRNLCRLRLQRYCGRPFRTASSPGYHSRCRAVRRAHPRRRHDAEGREHTGGHRHGGAGTGHPFRGVKRYLFKETGIYEANPELDFSQEKPGEGREAKWKTS